MSTSTMSPDVAELRELHERAEQLREEAAEAERGAFVAWQEAYGAYEVAQDEVCAAWAAWAEAITP
ncbi:MAG TPA: hypothetical protein VFO16_15780 [Pseudonocardiaceae bacterium]|nr:hypothetical protein [Pseudonocardiaceae bacterium]